MKKMMDDIIQKFGFENEHTINFFSLVEKKADKRTLSQVYDEYMKTDVALDEQVKRNRLYRLSQQHNIIITKEREEAI